MKVGFFGCGDADSYPDTFCDALGILYDGLSATGCRFVGAYVPEGYSVTDSSVCRGGKFVGLAVDENNESGRTGDRLAAWVNALKDDGVR